MDRHARCFLTYFKIEFFGRRARVQSPVGSSPAFIIRLVDPCVVSKYELLKELTESNNELLVHIYDTGLMN